VFAGTHYIFLETIAASPMHHRDAAQRLFMQPSVGYIQTMMDPKEYAAKYHTMVNNRSFSNNNNIADYATSTWCRWKLGVITRAKSRLALSLVGNRTGIRPMEINKTFV